MAAEVKQGTMDMQAMMETYKKLATPGSPHRLIARMEGSWEARINSWMDPDQPPVESVGTCEQKMVLDGRFLQQEFRGEMMENPFNGIGFMGYDNNSKKFVSTWMDTMGTGIYLFEGELGEDERSIVQTSSYNDPIQGPMKWRSVTRVVDNDTWAMQMYSTGTGGKEMKMMEGVYSRKK